MWYEWRTNTDLLRVHPFHNKKLAISAPEPLRDPLVRAFSFVGSVAILPSRVGATCSRAKVTEASEESCACVIVITLRVITRAWVVLVDEGHVATNGSVFQDAVGDWQKQTVY